MIKNPNGNLILPEEKRNGMKKELEKVFLQMIKVLEFDPEHPQLKDTPRRMAKMYVDELFVGSYSPRPKLTMFETEATNRPVFLGPITLKSMCSHHFLPFTGSIYISYIPDKKVVGISKLSRLATWFMRRPQIQEELTKGLCEYIDDVLPNHGLIVHCEASHMCMTIRGVNESLGSTMATTYAIGAFKHDAVIRGEFFATIERCKK